MENSKLVSNDHCEDHIYECERCGKNFKTKSSLSRHAKQTHWQIDLFEIKMKNEQLKLKIELYTEQIQFLRQVIVLKETFQNPVIRQNGMNQQNPSPAIEQ